MAYPVVYNLKLDLKCRSSEEREAFIALGRESSLSQKVYEILLFCAGHNTGLDELREAWLSRAESRRSESESIEKPLSESDEKTGDLTESGKVKDDRDEKDNINRYIIGHPDYRPEFHDKSEFPGIDEAELFDMTDDDPDSDFDRVPDQAKHETLPPPVSPASHSSAVPQVKVKAAVHTEIPEHLKGLSASADEFKPQISDAEMDDAFDDFQNDPEPVSVPGRGSSAAQSASPVTAQSDLNAAWDEEETAGLMQAVKPETAKPETAASVPVKPAEPSAAAGAGESGRSAAAEMNAVNAQNAQSETVSDKDKTEELDLDELNEAMLNMQNDSEAAGAGHDRASETAERSTGKGKRQGFFSRIMRRRSAEPEI